MMDQSQATKLAALMFNNLPVALSDVVQDRQPACDPGCNCRWWSIVCVQKDRRYRRLQI